MADRARVSIGGFAGCSSLGYSLAATLAAMGAGLANFTDSGIKNLFGTPAAIGALLAPDVPRGERLTALARAGLAEVHALMSRLKVEHAPFMVGTAADLSEEEQSALQREVLSATFVKPTAAWFPSGRASALLALGSAVELVGRGSHRCIVVGGIDSLCAPSTVRGLIEAQRVLGPHTEGTIPGEGAVFALVVRSDDPMLEAAAAVEVEAVARERAAISFLQADRVSGDGLAAAFRALRESGVRRVDRVVAAHSGEGYFSHSFSHAYLRELEIMPEPLQVDLTADCVGDLGAATGMLALAYGTYLMAEPGSGAGRVLAYSESDAGEIGAAVIAEAAAGRQPVAG